MKKALYTLLAVSIVFAACKKEDEVVSPTVIIGCTDVLALNYNPNATVDNGFCNYTIGGGCMDTIATNYDATATSDDGSCTFGLVGGAWYSDSAIIDIHAVVTYGGMIMMDSTWTEIQYATGSMVEKIKFWDNGDFKEWDYYNNLTDSGTWVLIGNIITATTDTVISYEMITITKTNQSHKFTGNDTFTEDGADYVIDYEGERFSNRNENGFTSNNTNQRKRNTSFINKRKLINSIKF